MAWKNLSKTIVGAAAQPISPTSISCLQAFVQPKRANANIVTVGGPTVAATEGRELGVPQASQPLDTLHLKTLGGNGMDLASIYIIGTNGQGISVLYEEY
jgi:hypothetical protein